MSEVIKIVPKSRVIENNLDAKLSRHMGLLTNEEYICNLKRHGVYNTVPDDEYKGANTSIYHICKIHNHRFKAQPTNVMNGYPCPLCNKEKNRIKNENNYKLELINRNIGIILDDKYISATEKVYHICSYCNNRWKTSPRRVFSNKFPCPKCARNINAKKRKKTQNEFEEKVKETFGETLSVVGCYIGSSERIAMHCNICGTDWSPLATNITMGHGCPHCRDIQTGIRCRKSKEQFINELYLENQFVEVIGDYIDSETPIECKCLLCDNIWYPRPLNLLSGCGCPKCNKPSKGEITIEEILKINNILYEKQKRFSGLVGIGYKLLSYDFYLPNKNILIEFQGQQHEKPIEFFGGEEKFKVQKEHDKRKREYAKLHNINLLEIWYYDVDNIESILLEKINETENNLILESVETVISA